MNSSLTARRWLPLLLILLLGAGVRFVALDGAPNGIFHDEAWSAAKARDILSGQVAPQAYFPENNGMDALHVYVIAAIFAVTGPLAIGSRLASALIGTLTILATYWLAWEWWPGRDRSRLALIAALVNATLFSAITTSRSGWHATSMALFSALSLAALLRARQSQAWRWFILAGVFVGLAQYAYPSARFIPVLVALIGAADVVRLKRAAVINYVLLVLTALIVFAPLGAFFLQQPEWLFVRARQVTEETDLLRNALDTLAAFFLRGDLDGLHNLAGRPLLDPILAVFASIGLFVSLRRRSAGAIALTALIVLTLPALVTTPAPLTRRWTGVWPIVALFVAAGVTCSARAVIERWPTRTAPRSGASAGRRLIPIGWALLLGTSALMAITDYFGLYLSNPQLFWAYDSGITQVANYVKSQPEAAIFLTPYDKFYEVIGLTVGEAPRVEPLHSYNGVACALLPERTTRVTEWVVVDEKDQHTLPLMQQLFPAAQVVWDLPSPVGPYAKVLRVPADQSAQLTLSRHDTAAFGSQIKLIGFEVTPQVKAGEVARVTLALKALTPIDRVYAVYVHLRGSGESIVTQGDRVICDESLNPADWRPGDIVLQDFELATPPDLIAGLYPVVMGVYDETGARLPVGETTLTHSADGVTLGEVKVSLTQSR